MKVIQKRVVWTKFRYLLFIMRTLNCLFNVFSKDGNEILMVRHIYSINGMCLFFLLQVNREQMG
jgi:hypothetical protein